MCNVNFYFQLRQNVKHEIAIWFKKHFATRTALLEAVLGTLYCISSWLDFCGSQSKSRNLCRTFLTSLSMMAMECIDPSLGKNRQSCRSFILSPSVSCLRRDWSHLVTKNLLLFSASSRDGQACAEQALPTLARDFPGPDKDEERYIEIRGHLVGWRSWRRQSWILVCPPSYLSYHSVPSSSCFP